jgi:hypothetical protein
MCSSIHTSGHSKLLICLAELRETDGVLVYVYDSIEKTKEQDINVMFSYVHDTHRKQRKE